MSHLTDDQLLQRFADHRDAEAFGRLVERHAGLVHATCRRETGDAALAEDAAQTVFLLLARKARSLRAERSLASWLFATARLASRNLLREERRRKAREARASAGMETTMTSRDDSEAISPHLNEALIRLRPADRQAVILRFMEGRSFAEVAVELNLGESAARMRVNRAIERLRVNLGRAGVTVTVAGLVAALDRDAQAAVPPSLLNVVSASSVASSGGGVGVGSLLAKGTLIALATTTTKTLVAASVATLLLGGGFVYVRTTTPKYGDETVRAAFKSLVGKWSGTTNLSSFQPNATGRTPMQIDFQPEDDGRKLKFTIKAPEVHHGDRKVMSIDPRTGHMMVMVGDGKVEELDMVGFADLASRGEGTLRLVGKPAQMKGLSQTKVSIIVSKDRLVLRQEDIPFEGKPDVQDIELERVK